MARIVYGAMGDALGHVSRGLALAQELHRHQFLFLGGGKLRALKAFGYPVEEIPMPATYYADNRVDLGATARNGLEVLLRSGRIIARVTAALKCFDPDLVITDYEFFGPLAARRLGLPCISLDSHHGITKCVYPPPGRQAPSRKLMLAPLRWMFSNADRYLISAFFQLPPRDPAGTEVFPPVVPCAAKEISPVEGDHVLVYQTSPTFHRLMPVLEQLGHPCIVYGLGRRAAQSNLVFKAPSGRGFLEDLASCRYLVTNGGQGAIAEALFFGKPVLAFPIRLAYEQFFNVHMLAALGYGDYCLSPRPDVSLFKSFETRLQHFRAHISGGDFYGNARLAARLEELAGGRRAQSKSPLSESVRSESVTPRTDSVRSSHVR